MASESLYFILKEARFDLDDVQFDVRSFSLPAIRRVSDLI